ncbi:hypothetical protein HNR23_000494 [Nocardiopsis mwathae]|uniref:Knr4/Smi1-like domain-containing protein n=1 Tax=Nocardiopsis mwathae TaxID=1472723 RepID=A0A7X0D4V1_9ACTN|nr:SMI1/KNR4 family protein [Nocardiopsis mwathae]MBB6170434.1 hypothetical protein [Nocardiopsis mwathae]
MTEMDMTWVERLCSKLGRPKIADLPPIDWDEIEGNFGTRLPSDYKYLCNRYTAFSLSCLLLLNPRVKIFGHRNLVEATRETEEIFRYVFDGDDEELKYIPDHNSSVMGGRLDMFQFYPNHPGLLLWGKDNHRGGYYWYVDGEADEWRVVAQADWVLWDQHPMSMSEYLVRNWEGSLRCRVLGCCFADGVRVEHYPFQ